MSVQGDAEERSFGESWFLFENEPNNGTPAEQAHTTRPQEFTILTKSKDLRLPTIFVDAGFSDPYIYT